MQKRVFEYIKANDEPEQFGIFCLFSLFFSQTFMMKIFLNRIVFVQGILPRRKSSSRLNALVRKERKKCRILLRLPVTQIPKNMRRKDVCKLFSISEHIMSILGDLFTLKIYSVKGNNNKQKRVGNNCNKKVY